MSSRDLAVAFPGGDRFELVGELGRGGMGVVYEVVDRDRRVRLALKGLRKVAPRAILRLKNEFRAVRDVHHPNLVRLDELFEHGGTWFFTMELVAGTDLLRWVRPEDPGVGRTADDSTSATRADGIAARWVREPVESTVDDSEGPARWVHRPPAQPGTRGFDEARLRAGMRGLVAGIAALHRAGIVHRDVKPSNVLVEEDGRVVLLDFGVVTDVRADVEQRAHEVVGTYAYMAPEQASADEVGPAADWYALGVVLFEALTGDVPFIGRDGLAAKLAVAAPSPHGWAEELPDDLVELCERLLRRDPAERPSEAELLALFGLDADDATAAFVGRAAERASLRAAFEEVTRTRRARAVFVTGESGIGKSALVRRFLDELRGTRPDVLILPARCDQREIVSYNAFDGVVDALARHLGGWASDDLNAPGGTRSLLRIFPVLRGVPALDAAGRRAPTATTVDQRALAFAALADLIATAAARRPVVIFVDDVHWADADSVALLGELFAGADAPPVLLVATAREVGTLAARSAVHVPVARIPLAGLAPAEAAALVRATAPDSDADAGRLAAETRGHPMFLAELARRSGARTLDDALWLRIGELDVGARALLEVIALAAVPLPFDALPAAAGLGPEGLARAVDALRGAHLVRVSGTSAPSMTAEPYHDRVRETVATRLDPARRVDVHRAIVTSLEAGGANSVPLTGGAALPRSAAGVELLAYHLAQAGDGARAAALAEAAARRALDALAFDRAAEWLRVTLELGDLAPERRRELLAERADLLARAGRTAEAADAFLAASIGEPPTLAAELRRRACEELLTGGHFARGRALARELADDTGIGVPASTAGAVAKLVYYQARLAMSRLVWQPRAVEDVAAHDRIRIDTAWSVSTGLSMLDSTRGAVLAMRSPLLALPAGDPARIARALCAACTAAAGMGRRRLAERLRDAAHRAATEAPDGALYAAFADVAYLFYLANEWHAAAAACERAASLLPERRGHTFETDVIEQHHVWALQILGELRQLRGRVPPAIRAAQRIGNRFVEISFRTYFAIVHLIGDRPVEALADVRDALAAWDADGEEITNPFFFALKSRSLIALYQGDVDADETLASDWARVRASLLYRIPLIRAEVTQWSGHLAVGRAVMARNRGDAGALARHLADARRWARKTRAIPLAAAQQLGAVLELAIAGAAHDRDTLAARMPAMIEHLDGTHQRSFAAACRWRLGEILGGSAGEAHRTLADRYFSGEGVARPDRLVAALLPA